jgi:glycosyltransferase involved in cell wall biosynthesis
VQDEPAVRDIDVTRWATENPAPILRALAVQDLPADSLKPADCLAVIPARDEAATVASVVEGVRAALGCDVLVVDDASRDDTAGVARGAGAEVLRLPLQLGAWGASQTGIRYARRHGYAGVLTLDADGQHRPESLPALFETQARLAANVVVGTCVGRLSRAKRLAWHYLRLLTGLRLSDFTSGLRLYDRRALELLAAPPASLLDYQDVGVLMLLSSHGLHLAETEVPMLPRRSGHSRVFASWPVVARYMLHTTVLCIARLDSGRRSHAENGSPC